MPQTMFGPNALAALRKAGQDYVDPDTGFQTHGNDLARQSILQGGMPETQRLSIGDLREMNQSNPGAYWRGALADRQEDEDFSTKLQETSQLAGLKSSLAGFNTPQAQGEYERAQKEREIGMPLSVAQQNSSGALDVAKENQRGGLEIAHDKAGSQLEALGTMLAAGGPAPGSHWNLSGVGGMGQSNPPGGAGSAAGKAINPATLKQLSDARGKFQKAQGGFFGGGSAEKAQLDQLIQGASANFNTTPEVRQLVTEALGRKDLKDLSFDDIIGRIQNNQSGSMGMDPEEADQFRQLLFIFRGF